MAFAASAVRAKLESSAWMNSLASAENLDRLERERGVCIIHGQLGAGSCDLND
jgi:hypothetical protein